MASVNIVGGPTAVSAPGSMAIALPDGVTPMVSVNGGAYTALGGGGFGSDTIVTLPNVATTQVQALRLTTTLTNNGVGTEASNWVVNLLNAGAATPALDIRPASTRFPAGGATTPSVAFQGSAAANTTGIYYDSGNTALGIVTNGTLLGTLNATSWTNQAALGQMFVVDGGFRRIGPNGDIQIITLHDVVIGSSAALATNATAGFLQIPTCAGTPTGTVAAITGKACLVYDTTNFKLALSTGGGTWKQTAALT
jgi:hypothetical protein